MKGGAGRLHPPAARGAIALAILVAGVAAVLIAALPARGSAPKLITEGAMPRRGRLLWLDGNPTVPGVREVAARDSSGHVLLANDDLQIHDVPLPGDVATVLSAAPSADGGLWVVDGQARLLRLLTDGVVRTVIPTPYLVPSLGGVTEDGNLVIARSVAGFPFALDTMPRPPVAVVDSLGRTVRWIGTATRPLQPLLSDLANAGYVLRVGSMTVFAPFVRDEIIAFGVDGDTEWTMRRGLAHETPDPRFVFRSGRPVLEYFPINLGIGLGPDGRLYALSTADTTLDRARLDVMDPATGFSLATFELPTVFPTIVVTRRGRIHLVSSDSVLSRAKDRVRPRVPAFDWSRLDGARTTQRDLVGNVTIVNVWASWCAPCREELPALIHLWQSLSDAGAALLAVNEDVRATAALEWLRENNLAPPVALAGGAARHTFGYPGLPYTMLVDREGRIVHKWIGYLGPVQIVAIERTARRELGLAVADDTSSAHAAQTLHE